MRHQSHGRKFGLKTGPRKAFMKVLAVNLIQHGHIKTTEARAKSLRSYIERLVTHGKKQTVSGMRELMTKLPKASAYKLYHDIAPRYADRKGGYTRITKYAKLRTHDGSHMARIEFV